MFHPGHRVASELMNIHSITVIPRPFETLKEIRRVCKENAEVFFLTMAEAMII
jgi:ubiquinone/menaquinone biosynthesis C-methylase UbiE